MSNQQKSRFGSPVWHFLQYHWKQGVLIGTISALLAASLVGLSVLRSSAEEAIDSSLRADFSQKQYALQTGDSSAAKELMQRPTLIAVQDSQGDIQYRQLAAPVTVTSTSSVNEEIGLLKVGARPTRADEGLLSEATAQALDVRVGDRIQLRTDDAVGEVHIVGLVLDPAEVQSSVLIRLVDPGQSFHPNRWLGDADFYADATLKTYLDDRTASYQSLDSLLSAAADNRPYFLSSTRFLPTGVTLLFSVVLVSVLAAFAVGQWRDDTEALTDAGMSKKEGWAVVRTAMLVVILSGEVLGALVIQLLVRGFSSAVSAWFGQRWLSVSIPWLHILGLITTTSLAILIATPLVRAMVYWMTMDRVQRGSSKWPARVSYLVTALSLLGLVWVVNHDAQPGVTTNHPILALMLASLLAGSVPFLLSPLLSATSSPAFKIVLRRLLAGTRPVCAAGAALIACSAAWTANTTYSANVGERFSSPTVPAGSFVISDVPDSALDGFADFYSQQGGKVLERYSIPNEATFHVRVTSPGLVKCMSESHVSDPNDAPNSCWPTEAASPISPVFIGESTSITAADPNLMMDGSVGLLLYEGNDGIVTRTGTTAATGDAALGGNLPGLVVPPDSPVVREFGLVPGGTSEVVLRDFSELTGRQQATVRAAALRVAPGAQTDDGTDPSAYDQLRAVASTTGAFSALAVCLMWVFGGLSVAIAYASTRKIIIDLGARRSTRWLLGLRWTGMWALTAIIASAIVWFTTTLSGVRGDASYGFSWLLPTSGALLAAAVVGLAFLRVPPDRKD